MSRTKNKARKNKSRKPAVGNNPTTPAYPNKNKAKIPQVKIPKAIPQRYQGALKNLVFTVFGHSYKHGISDREEHAVITARPYETRKYGHRFFDTAAQGHPVVLRLESTMEETATPIHGLTQQYLVVGFVLCNHNGTSLRVGNRSTKPIAAAELIDTQKPGGWKTIEGMVPFRVVTPLTGKSIANGGCPFFALIEPKDGLCTPFQAEQSHVFFFDEYRSKCVKKKQCRQEWKALVMRAVVEMRESLGIKEGGGEAGIGDEDFDDHDDEEG